MPFFSVVIPLYNKENFIVNTLNSVLAQTFSDFEVIIVNDGSTDSSDEKINQFTDSRIRYFGKENEGVSTARNFGIEKAASDYITFLDADDLWFPNFLEAMAELIGKYPDKSVFSAAIEIETTKNIIPARYSIPKTDFEQIVDYFEASQAETVICTSCAVFHKSVFENAGLFDITMKSGQDTDLWIRIGLKYKVVFCPQILARYVYDIESLSKNKAFVSGKANFLKYADEEKTNRGLKKFLDLNRFSLAVKSKLNGDKLHFQALYKAIDKQSLPIAKRIILELPAPILAFLIKSQYQLARIGLSRSVFK
jgi:glycosyltransferase involved in cell wall biosynthesis